MPTIKHLLEIALQPIGTTMYVWGGGWNETDDGAGLSAVTQGVSLQWAEFTARQTASYDYRKTQYQIEDGLDCSGYVGWVLYNLLGDTSDSYVLPASKMANSFAARGFGVYLPASNVKNHQAGDIMSASGHVYIVLGSCADSSVVLVHSSPPGVQLCGTTTNSGGYASEAIALARRYMRTHHFAWHTKYPKCARGVTYLTQYAQMRWTFSGAAPLRDPENFTARSAADILRELEAATPQVLSNT